MLSEAIRRQSRGEDVVIGVVETHGRKATQELAARLETVPRKKLDYKGTIFEEMDVDAILARHPQVVLVDELAHTNIEGSKHHKRYEDVFELLDNNIDVVSTMNVQHLESVTPHGAQDHRHRGARDRSRLGAEAGRRNRAGRRDARGAADAHASRRYLSHGARGPRAGQFLSPQQSDRAARDRLAPRGAGGGSQPRAVHPDAKSDPGRELQVRERIAVGISSNPAAQYLVARASRMAQAVNGELFVVYVDIGADETIPSGSARCRPTFSFAENLGAHVVRLKGKDVAHAMAEFVREKHITQVIFGHSATSGWRRYLFLSAVHRFLRDAPAVDVHIVKQQA